MTLGARLGIAAAAVVLLVVTSGVWYFWRYPLTVYALMNTRALANAGFVRADVPCPIGSQSVWTAGNGQTLVLLHGAGDSAGTWSSVVKTLTPRYRVVIPDLAGHGRSAPAEGPISVGQVLEGLNAVMAQAPQDPAIIVGNSLGAWAAMLWAREHPGRVARLVLVNGGALAGDRPDLSLMPATREEAAALMTQLRDPSAEPIPGFVLDNVVREAQNGPIARLVQTADDMKQYLLDGKLDEVKAPVDLLWGESDKLFSIAYARRMMSQLPAARLTTIPACGHVPQQECPVRFGAALSDVLTMPPPLPATRDVRMEAPGAGNAPGGRP
ncbi:MAG: alpha/beta fold hydrolase [Rhodospirillaceae bacterium]